jgi:hypothetical protein
MPTEAELLAAIGENILDVIDSAEDDDHAQELLAQYEHLLTEPEQMQALLRELEEDAAPDTERLAQEEWTAYQGPHGGKGWGNTRTGEVRYQEEKPNEGSLSSSAETQGRGEPAHRFVDGAAADAWGLSQYEGFKEPPRKRRDGTVKETPGKGGLTRDEYNLLRSYCSTGYNVINGMLRSGKTRDALEESWVQQIDAVMARNKTDRAVTAFRAASSPELRAVFDRALAGNVGAVIHDRAYVSTGLQMNEPDRIHAREKGDDKVMLEVQVPAGTPSMYLEHVAHMGEHELLLPRDSKFKVVGAREEGGKRWLNVEWIGSEGQEP